MAEKKEQSEGTQTSRQSRKEELRARKQAEQLRNVRIGVIVVGILLAGVIAFALINEYILSPQRSVATVGTEEITLSEFQDRVKFERAQRLVTLEQQLEMFNNDVGLVQQFSGQAIGELQSQNQELFGEAILNTMAQNQLVRQALAERGVVITEEEIDRRIEASYNYYGGESPTPVPTATDAPEPTPSVTPIGFVAEELPEEATEEVDEPAVPTATPVSLEAFRQEYDEFLAGYTAFGVPEAKFREQVADQIAIERLMDILAMEQELPREDVHASAFVLNIPTEEQLQETLQAIEAGDFLTVWNTARSAAPDPEAETQPVTGSEILWQTRDAISQRTGEDVAAAIFETDLQAVSEAIEVTGADGSTTFVLVMPTGREERPLAEQEFEQRKFNLLIELVERGMDEDVELGEYWRSRVPIVPVLDPKFLQGPTPAPELPVEDIEIPLPAEE